jgi:hypothetical protein
MLLHHALDLLPALLREDHRRERRAQLAATGGLRATAEVVHQDDEPAIEDVVPPRPRSPALQIGV